MVSEALFGVETEYAFTHFDKNGRAMPRELGLERMLHFARNRLESLPDGATPGVYLANGSRLYIDTGNHPEVSTPECCEPKEVVRYIRAGEQILVRFSENLEKEIPESRASIFRCNVDYKTGETWGCHESYLHRTSLDRLTRELTPHLVSRLIYTGAGGFDNISGGLDFMLSPRVPHLRKAIGSDSLGHRGIVHSRDEALCDGGYHRLHLLCGESQCSEIGSFLKIGTTALVVRLIEAGVCRGGEMALHSSLRAIRGFASDPTCTRRASLENGKKMTAIKIQRHYLGAVEDHLASSFMPQWAGEVCTRWRRMLDHLEEDPRTASAVLDWGIKHSLFQEYARKRGFDWEALAQWSRLIKSAGKIRDGGERGERVLDAGERSANGDLVEAQAARLARLLELRGADRDELRAFLLLRAELFELDTRFGELGPNGIFNTVDRSGVVAHHLVDSESVVRAVDKPPSRGRAHERGEAIRRLCDDRGRYAADWQGILDREGDRVFDLSDPFGRNARWTTRSRLPREPATERLRQMLLDLRPR
jgi:proteasome accessory factor A